MALGSPGWVRRGQPRPLWPPARSSLPGKGATCGSPPPRPLFSLSLPVSSLVLGRPSLPRDTECDTVTRSHPGWRLARYPELSIYRFFFSKGPNILGFVVSLAIVIRKVSQTACHRRRVALCQQNYLNKQSVGRVWLTHTHLLSLESWAKIFGVVML